MKLSIDCCTKMKSFILASLAMALILQVARGAPPADKRSLDVRQLPSIPNLPNVPSLPNLPDLPNFPNLPNLPDLPSLPNLPGVLEK